MSYILHSFRIWGSAHIFPVCDRVQNPIRNVCFMAFCHCVQACSSNFSSTLLLRWIMHRPWSLSIQFCISTPRKLTQLIPFATTPLSTSLSCSCYWAISSLSCFYQTLDFVAFAWGSNVSSIHILATKVEGKWLLYTLYSSLSHFWWKLTQWPTEISVWTYNQCVSKTNTN